MTQIALKPEPASAANEDLPGAEPSYELIELLFFAYRDFVGDPDLILAEYGFGRAHHRVLHFVERHPGLTIAELLEILRITKQSLNRVLKELIEKDFVVQRAGTSDRRQRRLHATERGRRLARRLAGVQTQRIQRALAQGAGDETGEATGETRAAAVRFLRAMIGPEAPTAGLRPGA